MGAQDSLHAVHRAIATARVRDEIAHFARFGASAVLRRAGMPR